ncbi:zinc ribbon domain-containing protein, partial [Paenibacillus forsythiae]
QLVQFTKYKAESAGRIVKQVDPRNTSQLCSHCGEIVKKELKERIHNCQHCGYVADRDVNAAINILQRATA